MLNGGCNDAAITEGRLEARPKLAPLFKQFVKESRALFQFVSLETRKLLRPLGNGMRPLLSYGITSYMPMLSCNLALAGEAATALHAATCALVAKVASACRLPSCIKVGPLKIPHFSPWEKQRH